MSQRRTSTTPPGPPLLPIGDGFVVPARARSGFEFVGRLRDGENPGAAQRELDAVRLNGGAGTDGALNAAAPQRRIGVLLWINDRSGKYPLSAALLAAVCLIFAVACVNVGALFFTRLADREQDLAIRAAMGGGLSQVLAPVACELAIIGGLASLIAAGVAQVGLGPTVRVLRERFGIVANPHLELAATAAVVLLIALVISGLLLGAVAMHRRSAPGNALRSGSAVTASAKRLRGRSAAIVTQLAAAFVLVVGSALLVRSYTATQNMSLGFDADHLFVVRVEAESPTAAGRVARDAQSLEHVLRALPGARAAAVWATASTGRPTLTEPVVTLEDKGEIRPDWTKPFQYPMLAIDGSADVLATLGLRLLQGRTFTPEEVEVEAPVVVLNALAAHRLWPRENPIGKRFKLGASTSTEPWLTVIGVCSNSVLLTPSGMSLAAINGIVDSPQMFRPLSLQHSNPVYIGVQAGAMTGRLAHGLKDAVAGFLGDEVVEAPRTYRSLFQSDRTIDRIRAVESALTVSAIVALILACLGVYALVNEVVRCRTRELGIRIALGATPRRIAALVGRQVAVISVAGLTSGGAAASVAGIVLRSVLYGSQPRPGMRTGLLFGVNLGDPLSLGCAAMLVAIVVVIAAMRPVWKATSVESNVNAQNRVTARCSDGGQRTASAPRTLTRRCCRRRGLWKRPARCARGPQL